MQFIKLALLFATVFFLGCVQSTEKTENTSENIPEHVSTTNEEIEEVFIETTDEENIEPSDEEIREYGLITNIEDGAYPIFTITVEFPERNMQHDFYLNIEEISLGMDSLYKLIDKYATIFYIIDEENNLYDLKLEDKSLFGEYAPEEDYSSDKITGILSGAETETTSDLPGKIFVTDENASTIGFDWYIDEMIVKANGKIVTAYYDVSYKEKITQIIPSVY